MAVIKRWECPEDGETAGFWVKRGPRDVLECGLCKTPMDEVEYVPASQLRGAVSRSETAEKIIRDLLEQLDPSSPYDQGEAVTAALHWLRGGQ